MVSLTDTRGEGFKVIEPNRRSLSNGTTLQPQITFTPHPGGMDAVLVYTNHGAEPAPLGHITLAGLRLAPTVRYWDFRYDSSSSLYSNEGSFFAGPGHTYPGQLYSPVAVIADDNYTIGVSLLYPILDYKHTVRVLMRSPGGIYAHGGQSWDIDFRLDGDLPPGQTRRYTLAVRVATNQADWVRTLVPYRDYFQALYGPVQYQRDPRPVEGFTLAIAHAISESNPRGYSSTTRRPDLNGWRRWANVFKASRSNAFTRTMVWTPSGLFKNNRDLNYPFLFMTPLLEMSASADTLDELASVAGPDLSLGFWWGRSQQVMRAWDQPDADYLDPDNPEHVRRAFRELDAAVDLGATIIGLDAYAKIEPWTALRWLRMLQEHAPGVTFIVEPKASDIFHRVAPTWLDSPKVNQEDVLADLILPGHETWVGVRYDLIERERGRSLTNEEKRSIARGFAAKGYVPVVFSAISVAPQADYLAAESWTWTIPPGLGESDGSPPPPPPPPPPDDNPDNHANNGTGSNDARTPAPAQAGVLTIRAPKHTNHLNTPARIAVNFHSKALRPPSGKPIRIHRAGFRGARVRVSSSWYPSRVELERRLRKIIQDHAHDQDASSDGGK